MIDLKKKYEELKEKFEGVGIKDVMEVYKKSRKAYDEVVKHFYFPGGIVITTNRTRYKKGW